jgi:hypothetical protein
MDEDFETFSNREDPILLRLFVYVFCTGLAVVAAAGLMFLLQTGVLFRPIAKYNMRDIEGSNKRILLWTKLAGLAGAGVGIYFSARAELRIHLKDREAPKR